MRKKKMIIFGANGQLAQEFQRFFKEKNIAFEAFSRLECDICDHQKLEELMRSADADVVINCAAYNLVDKAEDEPEKAFAINSAAVRNLATLCKRFGIFLVHFGTDYVFDGQKQKGYIEEDVAQPLSQYGLSKLMGEDALRELCDDYLVLRLSWVFGEGTQNFFYKLLNWAKVNPVLKIVSDEISVPTYTKDIVSITYQALEQGLKGTYHLTNSGQCSRFELAKYYFERRGLDIKVNPVLSSEFIAKAKRPLFSKMMNNKIAKELNINIPSWQDATDRFIGGEDDRA